MHAACQDHRAAVSTPSPSFSLPARARPVNWDSGYFVPGSRSSSRGRKAPCLEVAALILLCVCKRKEDDRARRTDPVPPPIPIPLHPTSCASPCPATKGHLPSLQTNQAFKFNSCLQPHRFTVIRLLIKIPCAALLAGKQIPPQGP